MLFLLLLVSGVMQGAPIALAGIGFAIIWYTTKEFHFLYGTLLATAGYLLYSLTQHGVNIWLAGLIVIVGTALLAAALENWGYIPLKNPLGVLLFSFGLAIVLQNVLQIIYGPANVILPANELESRTITVIPGTQATAQAIQLLALAAAIAVAVLLATGFKFTRTGLAMRAVMRDEEVASFVGIRPRRLRLLAYAVGTAVGSLGGIFTMISDGTSPTSGFNTMLFAFMATFLGAGMMTRVPLWGMLIGILLSIEAWKLPASFSTLIVFALMLVYVIVRERLTSLTALGEALRRWRGTATAGGRP